MKENVMLIKDRKEISLYDIDGVSIDNIESVLRVFCTDDMVNPELSYEYGYDGAVSLYIAYMREEKAPERIQREKIEQKQKEALKKAQQKQEEEERLQYEKLKKKYG
jgi:hypothetical protein